MKSIQQLRQEIDQIHEQLVPLFLKRLDLAEKIWDQKTKIQDPFLDLQRELNIIHQFDASVENEHQKLMVQEFQKQLIQLTKKYLVESLDKKNKSTELNTKK